ncbi:MAG: DUF1326 domain-containing protein [archaeon]|nr:MAG: DUF1326 domain-containing protein [archaeon]
MAGKPQSQKAMQQVQWHYKADIVTTCNCDWGCPCNFDAPPTFGYCNGGWALAIHQGHYRDVKLDGLHFAYMAMWPKAIHEGRGTGKLFIDEAASKAQRDALEQILMGKAGGIPWPLFAKTIDKWLESSFVKFDWKFDGSRTRYKAGDAVLVALEPIRNPVTGAEMDAKISLPQALTCHELNMTSTRSFSVFTSGMKIASPGKNGWYGSAEHGAVLV